MGHKFTSLFLIYIIYFWQINFIIIFQNIRLRLSNSANLTNSSNIFAYKCSWTTLSHSCRLVSVLICCKISVWIKLIILNSMRINFIIITILFDSQTTHSKTICLTCQILTLVCLIVAAFGQITWNVSERVERRFYYFVAVTSFVYILNSTILRSVCILIALLTLWNPVWILTFYKVRVSITAVNVSR